MNDVYDVIADIAENVIAEEGAKAMMKILEATYTEGDNEGLHMSGKRMVFKTLKIFDGYRAELERQFNQEG